MPELLGVRVFTSTQIYTPTAGTASVVVKCVGGGGGGGGCPASAAGQVSMGSGGGSGAIAVGRVTSGFSGVTITIGAGGAGGAAGANDGADGGNTSFGTVLTAGGGGHGNTIGVSLAPPGARYGGPGGTASGSACLFSSAGQWGRTAYSHVTDLASGGEGAHSPLFGQGGCQQEHGPIIGGAISAGNGYGSGGGGPSTCGTGAGSGAKAGAAGAQGICIVWEWSA